MDLDFAVLVCLVDNCTLQCEHGSFQSDTCTCACQKYWTGDYCGMLVLYGGGGGGIIYIFQCSIRFRLVDLVIII